MPIFHIRSLRHRFESDHARLRTELAAVDAVLARVRAGAAPSLGELRGVTGAFVACLFDHMDWEEQRLGPALSKTGERGRQCLATLERDHAQQRELVVAGTERLARGLAPLEQIARDLACVVELVRDDLETEEAEFLALDLLHVDLLYAEDADELGCEELPGEALDSKIA